MTFNIVKAGRAAALVVAATFAVAGASGVARAEIVGQLQCNIAPGAGDIIVSSRAVSCTYRTAVGPAQFYTGDLSRLGLDIGQLAGGTLTYQVISVGVPTPGALQGNYVGAGFGVTLGTGIGANALVGGNGNQFTLQPLSTTTSTGANINAGLGSLRLAFAGVEPPMMRRHHRHHHHRRMMRHG